MTDENAGTTDIVDIAEKQRYLYLLQKVNSGEAPTRAELAEIKQLRNKYAKDKSLNGNGTAAEAIEQNQLLKTQAEAAAYAGVSKRTIRRWRERGMPVTNQGQYIKRFLDFFKANDGNLPAEERLQALKADVRIKEAKAKTLELSLEERQEQYKADRERGNVAKVLILKRELAGMGRQLSPKLARLSDARKIARIIDDYVRAAIKRFAGQ